MQNLYDFSPEGMCEYFVSIGEKPFRATQMLKWLYQHQVESIDEMTNLSVALRQRLNETAELRVPKMVLEKRSDDGTFKWLLQLPEGNCVEIVFIPEPKRGTLCVSSQVGCALNCSFCATGAQGFNRNLTTAEIIAQVWLAKRQLAKHNSPVTVTNVVMMGMGEPLMNFEPVTNAMALMLDDNAFGLSKRRVTLSTSGVLPELERLANTLPVSLAVSLHATNDALRDVLVPINKKYPLKELKKACQAYAQVDPHRNITFEYVMLDGVNDSDQHARELRDWLKGVPGKLNLIPFNPFKGTQYKRSSNNRVHSFMRLMQSYGIITTVRRTRGDDIDAACGQLVGQFKDRTRRRLLKEKQQKATESQ